MKCFVFDHVVALCVVPSFVAVKVACYKYSLFYCTFWCTDLHPFLAPSCFVSVEGTRQLHFLRQLAAHQEQQEHEGRLRNNSSFAGCMEARRKARGATCAPLDMMTNELEIFFFGGPN